MISIVILARKNIHTGMFDSAQTTALSRQHIVPSFSSAEELKM